MNATIVIILFLLYMFVAFGLRTWQQIRTTGSTGFRGISGSPGSASWFGGVLFAFALALAPLAPVADLLGLLKPLVELPSVLVWSAIGLTLMGTFATYASQVAMGKSWRIGVQATERTDLVTDGPFKIVRNPIFSCMLVTALGLALLLPNAISLASILCLFVAIELQVRVVEEPYLYRTHGEIYVAYCRQVGRFVPSKTGSPLDTGKLARPPG